VTQGAIYKQMFTKWRSGVASGMRPQTAGKMLLGRAASTGLLPGAMVGADISKVSDAAAGEACGCR